MDSIIIFGAKYLVVLIVVALGITWLRVSRQAKTQLFIAVILAGAVAVILDKIAGKLYYDPRPFVSHHIKPLVAHAADNGFPSEHTLFGITLGTVIYYFSKKLGTIAIAIALIVGISRIAAHVHSPIDIVGATLIGVASGWAGYKLLPKVENFIERKK
jgi:undecaprenyl-diphosphatase